jgi:hypothetical protein
VNFPSLPGSERKQRRQAAPHAELESEPMRRRAGAARDPGAHPAQVMPDAERPAVGEVVARSPSGRRCDDRADSDTRSSRERCTASRRARTPGGPRAPDFSGASRRRRRDRAWLRTPRPWSAAGPCIARPPGARCTEPRERAGQPPPTRRRRGRWSPGQERHECPEGGTFDSTLPVKPRLVPRELLLPRPLSAPSLKEVRQKRGNNRKSFDIGRL